MLRKVREGHVSFKEDIAKLATTGTLGTLTVGDTLRQYKNAVQVAVTLISRTAIEGGLNAETAMTLTDHYFQRVEEVSTIAELTDVSLLMQQDFVERVRPAKYRETHRHI